MTTTPITPAEQQEVNTQVQELLDVGYDHLTEHITDSGRRVLRVGTRVRHTGEQYPQATTHGTATVVALLHLPGSAWARRWNAQDVEVVVLRDEERFPGCGRVTTWASYRADTIGQEEA